MWDLFLHEFNKKIVFCTFFACFVPADSRPFQGVDTPQLLLPGTDTGSTLWCRPR